MTISCYLADLEQRLPRLRRRRFLAEADAHLRDAFDRHRGSGLSPEAAEAAAIADFGPVDAVSRLMASEVAVVETRIASLIGLAAAGLFVVPLYAVPENTLPPAAWDVKPTDIAVLQALAVAFWLVAVVGAAGCVVAAWTRWPRLAATALPAVSVAMLVAGGVSAALLVRWFAATPATPARPLLATPVALGCLAGCVIAAVLAGRRCKLLPR